LANLHTSAECKALLAHFNLTGRVEKTSARVVFTKADRTQLAQVLVSSTATSEPAAGRAGLSKCKKISISTGLGRATVDISLFNVPKLGDDSLGAKLTVTVTGQGKTVIENAYLAEIRRGNTLDVVVLGDAPPAGGPVKPVDPSALGPLARTADAKVAKIS
jgi:hypothetical protein